MRRIVAALAGLLFVLLAATPANAAPVADPPIYYTTTPLNASVYEMHASYSWRCMDVKGGHTSPGAGIQTFDCKGQMHQRFYFVALSSTTFQIRTQGVWCLGGVGGSNAPNTRIDMNYCNRPAQTFRWVDRGSSHWDIVETSSGLCLIDTGRATPVVLGACATGEPWRSLWTPIYAGQYNYGPLG